MTTLAFDPVLERQRANLPADALICGACADQIAHWTDQSNRPYLEKAIVQAERGGRPIGNPYLCAEHLHDGWMYEGEGFTFRVVRTGQLLTWDDEHNYWRLPNGDVFDY